MISETMGMIFRVLKSHLSALLHMYCLVQSLIKVSFYAYFFFHFLACKKRYDFHAMVFFE